MADSVDDIVVVGASAGGVEALRALVASLPPDLPAPIVVVLHIPPGAPSALPAILTRAGPLPARSAQHHLPLRRATIYVAPPDRHVLVVDDHLNLSAGPSENGHRPAIDPLFRSAAVAYGARTIGIVLSGTRDDGDAGLVAIVAQGGTALVQDPADALYSQMPASALEHVPSAAVYPAHRLGEAVAELLNRPNRHLLPRPVGDELLIAENTIAAMSAARTSAADLSAADSSPLSCPACDGVLFRLPGEPAPRFRCRVGHAWSPTSLRESQAAKADDALWFALRAFEEKAATLHWLADHDTARGRRASAGTHRTLAKAADADATQIRQLLVPPPVAAVDSAP